jgi:hypothetical protein
MIRTLWVLWTTHHFAHSPWTIGYGVIMIHWHNSAGFSFFYAVEKYEN